MPAERGRAGGRLLARLRAGVAGASIAAVSVVALAVLGASVAAGGGAAARRASGAARSDGSVQAAYDGHPLYTYVGDSAPGQANGNGLNLNGGLWHEVPASG